MRKTIISAYIAPALMLLSVSCSSVGNQNEMSEHGNNGEASMSQVDCDQFYAVYKEQTIDGEEEGTLVRQDSVTDLSITGFKESWPFGEYEMLDSVDIFVCASPLSLDFLRNSKCIKNISIGQCEDVKALNIPFEAFTYLQKLRIYNSGNIPEDILHSLKELRELSLSSNENMEIDWSGIKKLKNLESLTIAFIGNEKPDLNWNEIGELYNLKSLSIEFSGDVEPDFDWTAISKLKKLNTLKIKNAKLDAVDETIGNFPELKWISLENNNIQSISNQFCDLTKLYYLNVSNNKLKALPDCLGKLTQLEDLNLSGNSIESIPESIAQLDKLNSLWLDNNQLSVFPKVVLKLKNVEHFTLYKNKFESTTSLYKEIDSSFRGREVTYHIDEKTHQQD